MRYRPPPPAGQPPCAEGMAETTPKAPGDRPKDDSEPDDDVPETPPTEPKPVPIEEPPASPEKRGPYIVD